MKCTIENTLLVMAVVLFLAALAADAKAAAGRKPDTSGFAMVMNPFRLFDANLYSDGAHRWRRIAIRLNIAWMITFVAAGLVLFYFPNDASTERCIIAPPRDEQHQL